MGRRGPPPTPTALKVIRGNPGRRPINDREPQPPRLRPTCPEWLDREARAEWKRVVPLLDKIGLLTKVDRAALAIYCDLWSTYVSARANVEKFGQVFVQRGDDGSIEAKESPYLKIADRAAQRIRSYCQEFGLTPSARGRMQVPGEQSGGVDDFEREYGG